MSALIILNVQNDFIEGGTINIPYSLNIIPIINRIKSKFKVVVFIKDSHPSDHKSFIKNGGTQAPHCITGTDGEELHNCIKISEDDYVINKGTLTLYDSASAFYNAKEINKETNLNIMLKKNSISNLYVCGISLEDAVFSTIVDAVRFRYKVSLISDATVGVDQKKTEKCVQFFKDMGVNVMTSSDVV